MKHCVLASSGLKNNMLTLTKLFLLSKTQNYISLLSYYLLKTTKNYSNILEKDLKDQWSRMNIKQKVKMKIWIASVDIFYDQTF